jgi:hypothetical protein
LPAGFGQTRTAKRLPVMTMVSGYSHRTSAVLIPRRETEDLFPGWWYLIRQLGAVPKLLVWDGEGAVGRWRPKESALTVECQAFRGVLGTKVYVCKPADPKAKGTRRRHRLDRRLLPAEEPRDRPHPPGRQRRELETAGVNFQPTKEGQLSAVVDNAGRFRSSRLTHLHILHFAAGK